MAVACQNDAVLPPEEMRTVLYEERHDFQHAVADVS